VRRIKRQDGGEMTPLCHELRHTVPPVDPEQGDDLTVTDQIATALPLIESLLAIIPEDQQRGLQRVPVKEGPESHIVKVFARDILSFEDYAFIIRQRGGRLRSVVAYVREDRNLREVRANLLVGGFVGGNTMRRAFWDIGVRVIRGSLRDERSVQRFRDRGYLVTESEHELGRFDVEWRMGEERP